MLAVKAKYEDGVVRWLDKPAIKGAHNLIVLFEDVADESEKAVLDINQLPALPELEGFVPSGWKEAVYGG